MKKNYESPVCEAIEMKVNGSLLQNSITTTSAEGFNGWDVDA